MIVPFPIGKNNGKGEIKLDQLNKPLLQGLCPAGGLGGLAAVGWLVGFIPAKGCRTGRLVQVEYS